MQSAITIFYNSSMKQTVLAAVFLSCLLFSSCGGNKTGSNTNNASHDSALSAADNVLDANQMFEPCHWSYTVEQNTTDEATLIATAKIDSGWHLYSQKLFKDGPLPTEFKYAALPGYKLEGSTEEINLHKEYDPFFSMEISYFEKEAVFRQKIKVLSKEDFTITGTIDYTACLTQCVTDAEEFSFNVKGNPKGE